VEEVFNIQSLTEMELLNKKGQTGGLVTGLVMGIIALVIAVIIAFVIISTLNNSGITTLVQDSGPTSTVLNENNQTTVPHVFLNQTGYTLANWDSTLLLRDSFTITAITNFSDGVLLLPGNYTLTSGILKNATTSSFNNISINYTYQNKYYGRRNK
jgi:hypothetical protein